MMTKNRNEEEALDIGKKDSLNKSFISSRPGKRFVFETGFFLNVLALVCVIAAYVTPYWIISWPRVYSPFKRMGLWEVCFAGMIQPTDPDQISYHGCWWILAPMYYDIRRWIMPGWVVYCQVFMTLLLFSEIANVLLHGWLWCRTKGEDTLKDAKYLSKFQTACIITMVNAFFVLSVVLVWVVGWRYDRMWLPRPQFNYLYGSYGIVVISAFLSIFASSASFKYVKIVRQEMREPPRSVPISGSYMPASSRDIGSIGML